VRAETPVYRGEGRYGESGRGRRRGEDAVDGGDEGRVRGARVPPASPVDEAVSRCERLIFPSPLSPLSLARSQAWSGLHDPIFRVLGLVAWRVGQGPDAHLLEIALAAVVMDYVWQRRRHG
jgi:hypothetical protein